MTDSEESRGGAETKPDSESPRERDVEMREAPPRSERTESYKVFVGGIPWQLDDYKLKDFFREFNPATATVMVDRVTAKSRGFGFVTFAEEDDMKAAIESLHSHEIEGRRISVTKAVPEAKTAPGTPAGALRNGGPLRNGEYRPRDDRRARQREGRPERSGLGPAGPSRTYDRGGYGRRSSAASGPGYDRGPDRGYGRSGERGYDRDYARPQDRSCPASGPYAPAYERPNYSVYDREPSRDGDARAPSRYNPAERGVAYEPRPMYEPRPVYNDRSIYEPRPVYDDRPVYEPRPYYARDYSAPVYDAPAYDAPAYDPVAYQPTAYQPAPYEPRGGVEAHAPRGAGAYEPRGGYRPREEEDLYEPRGRYESAPQEYSAEAYKASSEDRSSRGYGRERGHERPPRASGPYDRAR
uniref:RRM domain-containing protein n=1 Tax=Auxenochlorella protothecoides TaxID=3075 RepID=A0A1D2A427_AUXPR